MRAVDEFRARTDDGNGLAVHDEVMPTAVRRQSSAPAHVATWWGAMGSRRVTRHRTSRRAGALQRTALLIGLFAVLATSCSADDGADAAVTPSATGSTTPSTGTAGSSDEGGSEQALAASPIDGELAEIERLLERPAAATGSYVGALEADPDTYVAVVTDDSRVRVYLCDGVKTGVWFSGDLAGDSFSIVLDNGATVTGALRDNQAVGTFTTPNGSSTRSFVATTVDPSAAGLFRADITVDGVRELGGWIVAEDGTQRGVVHTDTTTGTGADATTSRTTAPAPALDPAAALATGAVGAAGGPLPVVAVTPQSLAAPVPTQSTGATSSAQQPGTGTGVSVEVVNAAVTGPPAATVTAPTTTAEFQPATVAPGTPTTLRVTIEAGAAPVTDGMFGIGLPTTLALVDPDGGSGPLLSVTTTCANASAAPTDPALARPGDPTVSVLGVTLAAGGRCTVSVVVSAAQPTAARIATSEFTSRDRPAAAPAAATLAVRATAGTTASPTPAPATTTAPATTRPATTAPATTAPATTTPASTSTTLPSQSRPTPVLFVSRGSGTSPLSVDVTVTGGAAFSSWKLLFSDGSGATTGTGAFPAAVPKTFVNTTGQTLTVSVDLLATLTDGTSFGPLRALVQVLPGTGGTPSARLELASAPQARRGQPGSIAVALRSDMGSRVAGPFAVEIDVDAVTDEASTSTGWSCARAAAALRCTTTAPGEVGPGAAPLPALTVNYAVPPTAPVALAVVATLVGPTGKFPTSVGGSLVIPVEGFSVDAGPDIRVGNRSVDQAGALTPTVVRLTGTATSGQRPQTFTWRQVAGPTLQTTTTAAGKELSFTAPVIAATTTYRFEFVVDDGVTRSSDTVQVILDKVNAPPVISQARPVAASATGVFVPTGPVQLSATVTDADNDAIAVTWSTRVLGAGTLPANAFTSQPISATGSTTASLAWPIAGVQQVEVTLRATDASGVSAVRSVVIGAPATPIGLTITGPTQMEGGSRITLTANPTVPSTFRWSRVSGPTSVTVPTTGDSIEIVAPPVDGGSLTLVVQVTATPTSGTATPSTATSTITITPGGRLTVTAAPVLDVAKGASVQLSPTVTGPASRTITWTQTGGPAVQLSSTTAATPTFTAPASEQVLSFRATVTAEAQTVTADIVVRVGLTSSPSPSGTGCDPTSVLARVIAGERTFSFGEHTTIGLGTPTVPAGCSSATSITSTSATLSLAGGFLAGAGMTARLTGEQICFVGGSVSLPTAYKIDPIALSEQAPLCWSFALFGNANARPVSGFIRSDDARRARPSRRSAAAGSCALPITGQLTPRGGFPLIDLGTGWTSQLTTINFTCDGATFGATAGTPANPRMVSVNVTVPVNNNFAASVTVSDMPLLGGRLDAAGSISRGANGAAVYSVNGNVTGATLPIPGLRINSLGAKVDNNGITVDGRLGVGSGSSGFEVRVLGQLRSLDNWSLTASVATTGTWQVAPGLSVGFGTVAGTLTRTPQGVTFSMSAAVAGAWSPVPGFTVTGASIELSNAAAPTTCAGVPVGSVWVRATGNGRLEASGIAPLDASVTACLGLPGSAGARPAFSLNATTTAASYRPVAAAPITIDRASIDISYQDNVLTLTVGGSATMQNIRVTARLRVLGGAGQPTVVAIEGGADLSSLGIGLGQGTLVFASGNVPQYRLPDGTTVAIAQGMNAIGVVNIGAAGAEQLNRVLRLDSPIQPNLIVTASLGANSVVLTGAISLGANGITLFATCPTQSTRACDPNGIDTTRMALTQAFVRLTLEGSSVRLGFGGQALLQLPPAQRGGPAASLRRDELTLDLEAFLQPPATVGLSLSMRGEWRNALGVAGLVVSGVALQGTVDFTVPTAPIPSIGVFGEVTGLPTAVADVLGVPPAGADGRRGETVRFALNIAPTAPIVELTVGDANGRTFLRPLAKIDGAATGLDEALTVDVASVVIAPLGGRIGTFTYPAGISARFGASIMGTPVQVQAVLDIANLKISASIDVGTFTIAGVSMTQTRLALEISPLFFKLEVRGAVAMPNNAQLSGVVLVQAGLSSGTSPSTPPTTRPPATPANPTVGLVVDVDLRADNLVLAPGNQINTVRVAGRAVVDALSADVNVQLGMTAQIVALGR